MVRAGSEPSIVKKAAEMGEHDWALRRRQNQVAPVENGGAPQARYGYGTFSLKQKNVEY